MNAFTPRAKAKILVDGGDPEETIRVIRLVGYVDGQTTNPTLVAKNPEIRTLVSAGQKFSSREELEEYKKIVQSILTPAFRSRCSLTSIPAVMRCLLKDAKCFPGLRMHTSSIRVLMKDYGRRKCPCVSLCAST